MKEADRFTMTSVEGGTAIKSLYPNCKECNFEYDKRCFNHLISMLKRLKEYEDTNLSPEEIGRLRGEHI